MKEFYNLSPVYGYRLSNHLPMAIHALRHLGMTEKNIVEFAKKYVKEKEIEKVKEETIVINNVSDFLGKRKHYLELVRFFYNEIKLNGSEYVIRKYIDELIEGSSCDAFHGLIRLAYAIEVGDDKEISRSLAYMVYCYTKFDIDVNDFEVKDPWDTVDTLSKSKHFKQKVFELPLISGRMLEVSRDKEIYNLLGRLPENYNTEKGINELAVKLYALTADFTALHGFTSTHALSIILPYLTDKRNAIQLHWIHIQIAYLSTNCTEISEIREVDKVTWDEIFSKALRSEDVHTHKLIYSLHKCFEKYSNEEWSSIYISSAKLRLGED